MALQQTATVRTDNWGNNNNMLRPNSQDDGLRVQQNVTTGDTTPSAMRRDLIPFQVLMITINATLGVGMYWRGGQVLELAGPIGVLVCFGLAGLVAWAVMQCISEMLCMWPVSAALSVYVSELVDHELGIVVGLAYWFAYGIGFAGLLSITASEIAFWNQNFWIDAFIVYLLMPIFLTWLNLRRVKIYGWIEASFGIAKLLFLVIVLIASVIHALSRDSGGKRERSQYEHKSPIFNDLNYADWDLDRIFSFDESAAKNWSQAMIICLSYAQSAYSGVEVVAATAAEAQATTHQPDPQTSRLERWSSYIPISNQFSVVWISVLAMGAYMTAGLLITFTVSRDDPRLPRPDHLTDEFQAVSHFSSHAAFTISAHDHGSLLLASAFNFFQVFTAITCANTNLYVTSRMFYGLTTRLRRRREGAGHFIHGLSFFGKTDDKGVPKRAIICSATVFGCVPFITHWIAYLSGDHKPSPALTAFTSVLTQMGLVAVVIVWACQCIAFLRYYYSIKEHKTGIERERIPPRKDDTYPYRSCFQPSLAWAALTFCLFLLLVANGATFWKPWHMEFFLSSYLGILLFMVLWVVLKLSKHNNNIWNSHGWYKRFPTASSVIQTHIYLREQAGEAQFSQSRAPQPSVYPDVIQQT